jgi:hypothetical protein
LRFWMATGYLRILWSDWIYYQRWWVPSAILNSNGNMIVYELKLAVQWLASWGFTIPKISLMAHTQNIP